MRLLAVPDGVREGVMVREPVGLTDTLAVLLGVGLTVLVCELLAPGVVVCVGVPVMDALGLMLLVGLLDGVRDDVGVQLGVG